MATPHKHCPALENLLSCTGATKIENNTPYSMLSASTHNLTFTVFNSLNDKKYNAC